MSRLQKQLNVLFGLLLAATVTGTACRSQEEAHSLAASGQGAGSVAAGSKAPFDVEAIMRQVHFSYREEQDGWHAGHSSYEVKATAQGLTLTPVHYKVEAAEAQEPSEVGARAAAPPVLPEAEAGAPLFLGPSRVTRGGTRLSVESPRGKVEKDGHLVFQHGSVTEHLRNSEKGVEQSWSFEAPPAGHGELEVALEVKGLVHTGTSNEGLHFADARTGLGFQYGHGTWVDSKGHRTAVRAEYAHGQIQLRVPEEVLAASSYPAVLDPVVSNEMIIDGRLVAADTNVRSYPSVAFNGTNFLVAWRDTRGTQYCIYGMRVSSTGTVLDTSGLVLSTGPGSAVDPQVASNGTDFQVVWSQFQSENWAVRGTRVTSAGVVVDPGGKRYSPAVGAQSWPHVASNGTDYLATWYVTGSDGYFDVAARRVSSAGLLLDSSDIMIASGTNYDETSAVVASNGTVYLVAWSDSRSGTSRVYANRVSSAGAVLDGTGFTLSGTSEQYMQAVASNGTDFFAMWLDYRNAGTRDLYGTRVTGSGVVVDGTGLAVSATASIQETNASLASDGLDYLATWTAWNTSASTFQILGSRISASAGSLSAVLDTTSLVLSANASHKHSTVTRASSGYLVAWDGTSMGQTDLYNDWVSSSGTVSTGSGFAVSTVSSLMQTEPAVASNGSNYLVVWTETAGSTVMIYGTRVTKYGGVLDVPGLQLTTASRERQSPVVASNGTDYLVAWMDYRDINWDIYGARVLGSGSSSSAVVDSNGFAISTDSSFENAPAVGSNGTDYLVAWRRDPSSRGDVYGARVTSAGVVQDTTAIAIATNTVEHYTPRVASNGTNYFVVWAEYASSFDIHGARVSGAGVVLDTSSIVISSALGDQYDPDVASNGTDFFAVWTDYRSGTNTDVYGARVSGSGSVLDSSGLALCTETVQQASPRTAFDGTNYVAAWADYRWGTSWGIYATQVTGSGTVVTPSGFSVVYSVRDTEPALALASGGGQQSMVVYSRYDTEPSTGSRRARGSFFSF